MLTHRPAAASSRRARTARRATGLAAALLCTLSLPVASASADEIKTAYQVFELKNLSSGLVADVPDWSTTPGTQIVQWQANGGANQRWFLRPVATAAGTMYKIKSQHSSLCLAPDPGLDGVIRVKQTDCVLSNAKLWDFTRRLDGSFRIRNVQSGHTLEVTSTTAGARLKLIAPLTKDPIKDTTDPIKDTTDPKTELISKTTTSSEPTNESSSQTPTTSTTETKTELISKTPTTDPTKYPEPTPTTDGGAWKLTAFPSAV